MPIKKQLITFGQTFNTMLQINKVYVTDENNHPIAVQVDIKAFEKIEELIEDYALGQFISENNPEDALSVNDAKAFYNNLTGHGQCK